MTSPVRVLVVDDAAFMRRSLRRLITAEPGVDVVGEAANGAEAVASFGELRPDVVCLDIDMPEMDGITALKHFMAHRPTPVIIVSSMTDRGDIPFEALRLGVIDFFPKPSSLSGDVSDQTRQLQYLVHNARAVRLENLRRVAIDPPEATSSSIRACRAVLAIGGTLGSVGALIQLLGMLPESVRTTLGIVFQAPLNPVITESFVASMGAHLGWHAVVPEPAATLAAGRAVFVPPGEVVRLSQRVIEVERADQPDSERGLDSLFSEVAGQFGSQAVIVLLAGDREDGSQGITVAAQRGARCFVQDPSSALFRGWSPAVGAGVQLVGLNQIADTITTLAKGGGA
jgi:two-component system chemotaxis response regulator CheB